MRGKETRHVRVFKENKARKGEVAELFLEGYIGELMGRGDNTQQNGMLIITNERVAFYRKGIFGEVFETLPFDKITSIETKTLLGHRTIHLHTSHDALVFKTMEEAKLFEQAHELIEQKRKMRAQSATAPSDTLGDIATQLEKLAELKELGALSQAEFEAAKARIIGNIG